MSFKTCLYIAILLLFNSLLLSCTPSGKETAPANRSGIVCLAPHLTESLFALGQGDNVIAIGDFDDYPPEAQHLPRVGGYINPNLEHITRLAPELIIVPGKHPKVTEYAALNHIPLLNIHMDNFETIDAGLVQLGQALGCIEAAVAIKDNIAKERARLEKKLGHVQRTKVLIITYRHSHDLNTLYTVGGTSFVSELVHLAGGENIFEEEQSPYFEAAKETVLVKAPEVILEFHSGESLSDEQAALFKKDWQAMTGIPAVAENKIYLVTQSHALRPGPRVMEIAWYLAGLLHPEEVAAK
jgi:iron complex transport system substrate-binding protein